MSDVAEKPFTWSYSVLKNFETCPRRHWNYDIAKTIKEPETDQQREGWDLHKAFEQYLVKNKPLPFGYGHHEKFLRPIREAPGFIYGEKKLAMTNTFQPCGYFDPSVWFRTVIDVTRITVEQNEATIFDWKTGKVAEDLTQLQLMTVTAFAHMPQLQRVKAALVFVNHRRVEPAEFTRESIPEIWDEILPRVKALKDARDQQHYPPKPSGLCKRYCGVSSCEFHGK